MTEGEFKAAANAGNVEFEAPSDSEAAPTNSALPTTPIEQFIPLLMQLQSVQQYLTAAPAFVPQTWQEQIQFVYDGSDYYLYLWINNAWQSVPFGSSEPSGTIKAYGGSSAPTGYLLCDGSAVSRTTYSALFGILSTTYGAGNGTTTFNIPDLRGNVPVGYKSGDTNFGTRGTALGEAKHTLTASETPSGFIQNTGTSPALATSGSGIAFAVNSGGNGHNNIQPSLVVNFIIKT